MSRSSGLVDVDADAVGNKEGRRADKGLVIDAKEPVQSIFQGCQGFLLYLCGK